MSKAEERALEACPKDIKEFVGVNGMKSVVDYNSWQRTIFLNGYHQAEKDLELTLEDVEIIINAFLDLCIENKEQGKTKRYTDKEWCQEVLKRFKERKEK